MSHSRESIVLDENCPVISSNARDRISAARGVATTVSAAKRKRAFHALDARPSVIPGIKCQIIPKTAK